MNEAAARKTFSVIGSPIDAVTWADAVARVLDWAKRRESRYVCICNVHSVVTATRDPEFSKVLKYADMATPDGAPVAWMLRRLGAPGQQRIDGPDLMLRICEAAQRDGVPIYLFGNAPETLGLLQRRLKLWYPGLCIAGATSPPFRTPSAAEAEAHLQAIRESGAAIVFVSLGCPKQELWMADQKGRVPAVMIGVGAAFDFHAGTAVRAPVWVRSAGLEWLHRLANEPRRLWRRYLITNTIFIVRATLQLLQLAWQH